MRYLYDWFCRLCGFTYGDYIRAGRPKCTIANKNGVHRHEWRDPDVSDL